MAKRTAGSEVRKARVVREASSPFGAPAPRLRELLQVKGTPKKPIDDAVGVAVAHRLDGQAHARLPPLTQGDRGLVIVADGGLAVTDFTYGAELGKPLENRPQPVFVAEQQEAQLGMTLSRHIGSLDDHIGRALATHGVQGDDDGLAAGLSHGDFPTIQSCAAYATPDVSMTSRPL